MDMKQGLLCGLTNEKAAFQESCEDYQLDDEVVNPSLGLGQTIGQKNYFEIHEKLRKEQNLYLGVGLASLVGLIGALLWGIISVKTGYQVGYVAIAIGAGVGLTMRRFGKGIDFIFGYCGAGLAFLSVLVGNFFSVIGFIANEVDLGYIETLVFFDYSLLFEVFEETFSFMDIVFYGLAIYQGYKFSFREVSEDEVIKLGESDN